MVTLEDLRKEVMEAIDFELPYVDGSLSVEFTNEGVVVEKEEEIFGVYVDSDQYRINYTGPKAHLIDRFLDLPKNLRKEKFLRDAQLIAQGELEKILELSGDEKREELQTISSQTTFLKQGNPIPTLLYVLGKIRNPQNYDVVEVYSKAQ
ncbi:hypothetical protein CL618_00420 [archaeon]|nr:hypothetical protein [archaeon]